jgi:hypothetical protein
MRKLIAAVLLGLTLIACGQAPWEKSLKDVEGAQVRDPDYIMLTNNVDKHPNVVILCAGGFGFWTTTRPDFSAASRLPEMDTFCESVKGQGRVVQPAQDDKPASWKGEPSLSSTQEAVGYAFAKPTRIPGRWEVAAYRTHDADARRQVFRIRERCMAEDTLAHLRLLTIDHDGKRVLLGCYHKGY